MTPLRLFLFGTPRLQREGQPLPLKRRKALALLAYVAITGRPQSREALATLLWSEQDLSTGLTNLRSELYRLRKLLGGEIFRVERSHIGLTQPLPLWFDVAQFQERLTVVQQHEHPPDELCPTCAIVVAEGVALYTEDFMAGFNLPDTPAFDEWQFFQTQSLRQELAKALQQLIAWHSQNQSYEPAIGYARRWLALDELHEPAHRQLMVLYAKAGQQSAALRQYEICQHLLEEELDVAPEPATQELAEAIRLRRYPGQSYRTIETTSPSSSTFTDVPYQPPFLDEEALVTTTPPVFVARENELAALTATLETARTGQGQLLFVIGGAGRGKTMLVQEFARRAQADDPQLIVVRGTCKAQIGIGDPYLPFREALSMLTGDVEALWAGGLISTAHARRLWTFMPVAVAHLVDYGSDLINSFVPGQALLERATATSSADSSLLARLEALVNTEERQQIQEKHLFAQITAVLKATAAHQPLLLILEDLHWADTASISLLFHLSRAVSDGRILIAGTYRPDEVSFGWDNEQHPLARITGELKRRHGDIWLDLGEMAALESLRFVDGYLDTQPNRLDTDFRQALLAHTGGHALFTVELLRDMQERGDLRQDDQDHWIASESINWQTLPAKVEGVIEHRMHRLHDEAKSILTAASVEGETFTAEVVARVQGLDERELVRRLSQELDKQYRLVTAQALERLGSQRLSIYQFRHNLFQHYLYHSLAETERAYLHEAVGNALEAIYENQAEKVAVPLAYHFEQAGLIKKATEYLLQAGKQATLLSANKEAVEHFHRGLGLLRTLPDTPERDQRELQLQLALAMSLTASQGYVAPEVQQALDRARTLAGQMAEAPQLGPVLFGLSRSYMVAGQHQPSRELAEQLLQIAESIQDPEQLLSAHYAMGLTLFYHAEFQQALNHSNQVIALYEPAQHPALALRYGQDPKTTHLGYAAMDLWFLGYVDQARRHIEAAVSLAQELSHWHSLAHAHGIASLVYICCREGQVALDEAEAVLSLATEREFPQWVAFGGVFKGAALVLLGQHQAGLAQLNEILPLYFGTGAGVFKTTWLALLAEAYAGVGELEKGLSHLEEALAAVETMNEHCYEAELYRLQGELLLAHGAAAAEAEARYQQAMAIAHRQQAKWLELRATTSLARLWQMQGKRQEARQMLTEIYSWFSEGFDTVDMREARALLEALS